MAILAVLVKLDSRGPALFSQTRVGLRGRTFRMLKLRTMRDGAEHERDAMARAQPARRSAAVQDSGRSARHAARPSDSALEPGRASAAVQRARRRTCRSSDHDRSSSRTSPTTRRITFGRLAVKPGLTGMWQVSGRSDIVDFEEVVRLDRYYIEHWSLGAGPRHPGAHGSRRGEPPRGVLAAGFASGCSGCAGSRPDLEISGFETAFSEIAPRLVERGHAVTIYCRAGAHSPANRPARADGVELVYMPSPGGKNFSAVASTGLAVAHALATRRSTSGSS